MKGYWREPDAFFGGVAGLTLEQIGAYTLIIDRLYALDGVLPDNDTELARAFHVDPRVWIRVKRELIAKGKIRTTREGMLDANGVASRRLLAEVRSTSAKHAADVRWTNYRKSKENNEPLMRARNASLIKDIYSSTSVEAEQVAAAVDKVAEQSSKAKPTLKPTSELEALVRRKQQFDKDWR